MLQVGKLYKIIEHPSLGHLLTLRRQGINIGDVLLVTVVWPQIKNSMHPEYKFLLPNGTFAILNFGDDSFLDKVFQEHIATD